MGPLETVAIQAPLLKVIRIVELEPTTVFVGEVLLFESNRAAQQNANSLISSPRNTCHVDMC